MNKGKALTPKLRFPEFRGAAGWKMKIVGPYLEDCSQRVPSHTELPVYSSTREGLKRQDDYFDGRVLLNENDYGVVPHGCFVYRHMSDDGTFKFNINQTGGDIAVSKEYPVFRTKGLNPLFLLAKLNEGPDFKQFALSQKAGGTRTRLYFSRLCEWKTLLPLPPEQQKIAECLSSVDELIAAQARKLDALKTHKKGLMQQLFPREGETQPRLRFPEFQNAGEWTEEKLDDIFHLQDGFSFKSPEFVKTNENATQVVRITDINNKNTNEDKVYIPNAFLEANNLKKYYVENGDLLLSLTGAAGFNFFFWDGGRAVINQRTSKVTPKKKLSSAMARLLEPLVHEKINVRGEGQNNNLSKEFLSSVILLIPEPDEQQRIANCLTSLDDLIAAQTQKLDALKTHKKGLMQQLFPLPVEVEA